MYSPINTSYACTYTVFKLQGHDYVAQESLCRKLVYQVQAVFGNNQIVLRQHLLYS